MYRLAMILTFACALAAADPLPAGAVMPATAEEILTGYRDKNRVLLVFTPSDQDPSYVEQMRLWKSGKAEFDDRQLVVLPVFGNAPSYSSVVEKKYGVAASAFAVVLIGKDGHDAYRADKPVKPETLYGLIDAMPMRKAEMKRAKAAKPDKDHDE